MTEADILDTALNMIGAFGEKAFSRAMERMELYWAENKDHQKHVWLLIANTIGTLMRTSRGPDETLH